MKDKVDILFIPAPIRFKTRNKSLPGDDTSTPPLGLMYVATYLNSKGYNCKILHVGLKNLSLKETVKEIKKIKPRVVGISILTSSSITSVPLAKAIKKEMPKIIVGCGGVHVCIDPTFIKRYPFFDFGVKGEGEEIMYEIMKKIDHGEKVKGIYDGGYVKNIDTLPFPDFYHLIDFKEYGNPSEPYGKRSSAIVMMTSRGCPFQCSFCCKTESRKYVRYRTPKRIVDEIEENYPLCKVFNFVDDTMTLNQKNTIEISKEIIRRKLKISWLAMTRADCMTEEAAILMAKSGCREVFIGVESGDTRIRNNVIKKKVTDEAIFKAIKICRKVGIRSSIFLMLGFPTEGKEEIEKTVNYPFISGVDMMGIHLTFPLPGSELWDQAIKEKIIPKNLIDLYIQGNLGEDFSSWPKYIPKGTTMEYMEQTRARAIRKFYLSPQFIFRLLIYYLRHPSRIKYDKDLYKNAFRFLLQGKSIVQFT